MRSLPRVGKVQKRSQLRLRIDCVDGARMGYSGSRGVIIWPAKVALDHLESGNGHLPWSAGRVIELEAKPRFARHEPRLRRIMSGMNTTT